MRAFLRSPAALVLLVLTEATVNLGWVFFGRVPDGAFPLVQLLGTSAVGTVLVVLWVVGRRQPPPPANPFLAEAQQDTRPR